MSVDPSQASDSLSAAAAQSHATDAADSIQSPRPSGQNNSIPTESDARIQDDQDTHDQLDEKAASSAGPDINAKSDANATSTGATAESSADKTTPAEGAADPGPADGSAKKNSRRKSAGGVPEHKNKKLQRKKSTRTLHLDAEPGDYFLARMKGYPPWPSVVCDEEMLPENLLISRPVTAKRPDGTYRDDYAEGGKNERDRTFPVMFLYTNEFAWTPNTDLTPIDLHNIVEPTGKKTKALAEAWEVLKKKFSLDDFKEQLSAHAEEVERLVKEAEDKAAKKEKKTPKKGKAKADSDADVEMDEDDATENKPKSSSKKRKAEADPEPKKTKTPKTAEKIRLSLKNGDSASKGKSSTKSEKKATKSNTQVEKEKKAEPQETAAERAEKVRNTIFFFRHKLQKGFISREEPPADGEMPQLDEYMTRLEQQEHLDDNIIKQTKIHKVLKAIVKLGNPIPQESRFNFKERSRKLLAKWDRPVTEDDKADDGDGKDESKDDEKAENDIQKEDTVGGEVGEIKEASVQGKGQEASVANGGHENGTAEGETKDEVADES